MANEAPRAADYDRIVVLDTETTGLSADCGVVEIAWIEVDAGLAELERVNALVNPGCPIEPGAVAVHGITEEMVADQPTLEEFLRRDRSDQFGACRTLVIAHHAAFDEPHLAPYCAHVDTLCTLRLAQHLLPDLPDHKLQTVAAALGLEVDQPHRALDDAVICLHVVRALAARTGDGLDGLLARSHEALVEMRMPFGKHRGTPIRDLPTDYVAWMRREMRRLDGDLETCLDLHHPIPDDAAAVTPNAGLAT